MQLSGLTININKTCILYMFQNIYKMKIYQKWACSIMWESQYILKCRLLETFFFFFAIIQLKWKQISLMEEFIKPHERS